MSHYTKFWVAVAGLALAGEAWAGLATSLVAPRFTPVVGGREEVSLDLALPTVEVPRLNLPRSLDDPLGEIHVAGTTYYDYQHNGTVGKMIGVDVLGGVQVVWMNGLTPQITGPRHVYWNAWNPESHAFLTAEGTQVNSSNRAGYISQTTNHEGWCFPAFHETVNIDIHAAAGMDSEPRAGEFTITEPEWILDPDFNQYIECIYPVIASTWSPDMVIHMVSIERPMLEGPLRIFYSRGEPTYWEGEGADLEWQDVAGEEQFVEVGQTMTLSPCVAASRSYDRVAIAWAHPRDGIFSGSQLDNDLYLIISEDAGLTWGDPINITAFPEPDQDCASGDTLACNRDTFRLYTDCEVFFDEDDFIHVGFTTRTYYGVGARHPDGRMLPGPLSWIDQSGIWHWGEQFEEFTPIASDYFFMTIDGQISDVGAWQLNVQRPSFAQDAVTGYLYCSFMRYDSNQYSDEFYHMADAWVAVSMNNGRTWSIPTNVTDTDGGAETPPPGSLSERDISIAERVTYSDGVGYLHMQYVLDLDAGGLPQNEGTATLNPVIYQRIPVLEIPTLPLGNPFWPVLHADSTGYPLGSGNRGAPTVALPATIMLHQNYPNPFNATTTIVFELSREGEARLAIFNVSGQEVARLVDGERFRAGVHVRRFEPAGLASGVYFARLQVDGLSLSRKMVLMR